MSNSAFRFSSKPNRAHEINWHQWGPEVFAAAKEQDKPIFITIGNDWCHSCALMDETSYSQPEVARILNERFVPVRVDADQHPDIASRYNLGGWPTTAVLAYDGELISGSSYVAPAEMAEWLRLIEQAWREQRNRLLTLAQQQANCHEPSAQGADRVKDPQTVVDYATTTIFKTFDDKFAGFHHAPKLPMTDALDLAMYLSFQGYEGLHDIFYRTIKAMYGSELHDPVEGGFFRYAGRRDWTEPHYEKLLEDNAKILGCCLDAYRLTKDEEFKSIAADVFRFLELELLQPESGLWSGSQAADKRYYRESQHGRRQLPPPHIDRHIFINSNAAVVRVLLNATVVIDDPGWAELGLRTLDELLRNAWRPDLGMAHVLEPDTLRPYVWGLLMDQIAMGEALLSAYQYQAHKRYLDTAISLADIVLRMQRSGGALTDRLTGVDDRGLLSKPYYDFLLNSQAARWFARLAALARQPEPYTMAANRITAAWEHEYQRYGLLACNYALAVHELQHPWTVLTVVGDEGSAAAKAMLDIGLSSFAARSVSRLLDVNKHADIIESLRLGGRRLPAAWICHSGHCDGPMYSAEQLDTCVNAICRERL